jgi:anti-sigma regulatory factor (Ser/Thr protein kinase)
VKHGQQGLVICLREAPPFDPANIPAPDLTVPLEQRADGGMGIHLIRQVIDQIVHRITSGGGNELLLVKRLEEENENLDIYN